MSNIHGPLLCIVSLCHSRQELVTLMCKVLSVVKLCAEQHQKYVTCIANWHILLNMNTGLKKSKPNLARMARWNIRNATRNCIVLSKPQRWSSHMACWHFLMSANTQLKRATPGGVYDTLAESRIVDMELNGASQGTVWHTWQAGLSSCEQTDTRPSKQPHIYLTLDAWHAGISSSRRTQRCNEQQQSAGHTSP